MIENAKEILERAKEGKYAIPHFNINNLEWTKYILEECERLKSPVILGVSEGAAKYMGGYTTVCLMVSGLVYDLDISIPVAIHLDHGSSVESCKEAIEAGFTSVMIDYSKYPLNENIKATQEVLKYADLTGVSVEAEIGYIGNDDDDEQVLAYAKLEDIVELYENTKVDFLAPAIGSVHGVYKGLPKLDFDLLSKISLKTKAPLVLHGGSGIPDEMLKKAISLGISKINFNTELQVVFSKAVREFLNNDSKVYDPRKIIKSGEKAIKEEIAKKIEILNSSGKVNYESN